MHKFGTAYQEIEKAIYYDQKREMDTETAMNYDIYASICAELAADGIPGFYKKADKAFRKVIAFREKHMGKYHPDLGVGYHKYSLFLYYNNELDKAEKYTQIMKQRLCLPKDGNNPTAGISIPYNRGF